jgi:hypothetical protein
MKQAQYARDRKEKRNKEQREMKKAIPKDLAAIKNDPNADKSMRDLVDSLDIGDTKIPEWKQRFRQKEERGYKTDLSIREQQENLPIFKLK